MKKREDKIGLLVIRVVLRSHPIDVALAQTMFAEKDGKKRISTFHFLKGNWNFRFLVV